MGHTIRLLCKEEAIRLKAEEKGGVWWLVGSSSMPFTVFSILHCLHFNSNSQDPDYEAEADDIRSILPKGLEVVGSILVGLGGTDAVTRAGKFALNMSRHLSGDLGLNLGVVAANLVERRLAVKYCVYKSQGDPELETPDEIIYETKPHDFLWQKMCLMRCEMQLNMPLYGLSFEKGSDLQDPMSKAVEMLLKDVRSSQLYCLVEGLSASSKQSSRILLKPNKRGNLNTNAATDETGRNSKSENLQCSYFGNVSALGSQVPNPLKLTFMVNRSNKNKEAISPFAELFPASETTMFKLLNLHIDVLCVGTRQLHLDEAVASLAIPALMDQLSTMKKVAKQTVAELPQLCSFHFHPEGFLHPISSIYDLSYNELETAAVEVRRNLHCRLGLPLDRPFFRITNALNFSIQDHSSSYPGDNIRLHNVHIGLPISGVNGGRTSLIQGSYEYYHYLQDGFDDRGWGCAYRSLQTIISWFKLQHYTAIDAPSHRKIQETLVEIGDKDPLFVGSREWIGAIELSFVLDKLLGVTCKILNVRSGSELPEKCRELAFHFETQGTPVMIGGGVLAYTLLGVDYNEATGESSFLILDPHYTGSDDLKNIWSGEWCGWKKAVSSKGEEFFLRNTFYNLLLPQRPNIV